MSSLRSGGRGAAGWLVLAVLTAAAGGAGSVLAAGPAQAGSLVTVTATTAETTPGDGTCSLAEALAYAQRQNGSNTDCGTTATGTTVISLAEGTYAVPPAHGTTTTGPSHLEIGSGSAGPVVIQGQTLGTIGTTIDGQAAGGRVLLIDAGATVILKNLTLRGGVDVLGFGGGINNQGTLSLDHVTVTGNRTQAPSVLPAIWVPFTGGGIYNTGTLNLIRSVVAGNSTDHGYTDYTSPYCIKVAAPGSNGADGGGIYNQGGTVTATYTAIAGNTTGAGGDGDTGQPGCQSGGVGGIGGAGAGIYNNRGTVALHQSAVYGNTTGGGGSGGSGINAGLGGMGGTGGAGGGIFNNGQLTVTDTTITGNVTGNAGSGGSGARSGGGGPGGGIFQVNGHATVQESTVASNVTGTGASAGGRGTGTGPGSGIYVNSGDLTEIDTIVSNNTCATYLTFGQINDGLAAGDGHLNLTWPATTTCPGIVADPQLGPLQDNGGPTSTMAITPPSPAIDRVPPLASAGCTTADQRGIPRPQPAGGRCDIGAYEYQH